MQSDPNFAKIANQVFDSNGKLKQGVNLTPEQLVQSNLEAYNQRDIIAFMSYFSDNIAVYGWDEGKKMEGKSEVEKFYKDLFDNSPKLHSTIVKRIVLGNKVIDHENIIGRRGSDIPIEMVLVYEVKDEKIFKITVIK
jgi:hypothetical protein